MLCGPSADAWMLLFSLLCWTLLCTRVLKCWHVPGPALRTVVSAICTPSLGARILLHGVSTSHKLGTLQGTSLSPVQAGLAPLPRGHRGVHCTSYWCSFTSPTAKRSSLRTSHHPSLSSGPNSKGQRQVFSLPSISRSSASLIVSILKTHLLTTCSANLVTSSPD